MVSLSLVGAQKPKLGDPATFMCSVTSTGFPVANTISWYRETTQLAGEISSTLVIPATALEDNGSTYECIVDNGMEATSSLQLDLKSKQEQLLDAVCVSHQLLLCGRPC